MCRTMRSVRRASKDCLLPLVDASRQLRLVPTIEPVESPLRDLPQGALAISPWCGLALSLVAGAIVFGIMQGFHPIFLVPEEFHAAMGAPPEVWEANKRETQRVGRYHAL